MDDMKGTNWVSYGSLGSGVGQFNKVPDVFKGPQSIFVDQAGKIYIADAGNARIVRIDDLTGKNWMTFGANGDGRGQQKGSVGIFIDSKGRIHLTDPLNNRVIRIDDMSGAGWTTLP
jgi:streptogramin lyase